MNYKLKHLAKFCTNPANELEFEAVKMAAEIGGIVFDHSYSAGMGIFRSFKEIPRLDSACKGYLNYDQWEEITVLDFCNKLRMSEEEAEKLEDDRVASDVGNNWEITDGAKVFKALNGHYFKTNDGAIATEVTLHKK